MTIDNPDVSLTDKLLKRAALSHLGINTGLHQHHGDDPILGPGPGRTYLIESMSIYTGKLKGKLVIKKVQRVSSDTKRSSPDSI